MSPRTKQVPPTAAEILEALTIANDVVRHVVTCQVCAEDSPHHCEVIANRYQQWVNRASWITP
jgi:hypothetical protein